MASGTIKSYTRPSGSTGEGAHWSFEWTSTKKSAGVSTVSWNLYTRGRYSSPTWLETGCWMSVTKNGATTQLYAGDGFSGSENSFKDIWRASGSFDVTHDPGGAGSFQINFEVYIYAYAHQTNSGTGTLDNNPTLARLTSAPDFNDEQNPTISYSNPAGNSASSLQACISLTGSAADVAYRDISKTGTSYTFPLTEAERNVLRNATSGNSRTVSFHIKTIIDGTTYYDSIRKTLTIVNANPVISASAVDTNSTTVALTGDNTKYIRHYSDVKASMTATGQKGATITSTSGNATYNDVTTNTFTFSATDSRGNSSSKTVTGTLIPYVKLSHYFKPRIAVSGAVTMTVSGDYYNGSFGAVNNTLTLQYRYKTGSSSYTSWTSYTPSISGNSYNTSVKFTIPNFNYKNNYTFQIKVADKLATITSAEYTTTALPVFDWGSDDFNVNGTFTVNNNPVYAEEVLYNNSSGSDGTITLPVDASAFQYLEIFFTDNNGIGGGYLKVFEPNGKTVDLFLVEASEGNYQNIRSTRYTISSTSVTPSSTHKWYCQHLPNSSSFISTGNLIKIKRIVGMR